MAFRVGRQLYALPTDEVVEVIRVPPVARVPQSPGSLMGLSNLRGSLLPIASARGLLQQAEGSPSRAIVLAGRSPVGLAVDSVEALVTAGPGQAQMAQVELASEPGEKLRGAFQIAGRTEVVKVLDIWPLLDAAFKPVARQADTAAMGREPALGTGAASPSADRARRLVTFDVAGQEFALYLDGVQEVVPFPQAITAVPQSDSVVLGVSSYRDVLLPLLSIRSLLGLAPRTQRDGREKVLVVPLGQALAGLVVDRIHSIVPTDPALLEPTPPLLAARTGGECRISAIYRGENGHRLISILSKDKLFREDVMQRVQRSGHSPTGLPPAEKRAKADLQFVAFRLGDDEFALPIDVVEEVAHAPSQITRVPKTPKFLEGVVNLRGQVLPVVDQRRRFGMPPSPMLASRRLIVVRTERHRAGLIVDSVTQVLRSGAEAIQPAPDLAGEDNRLVHGVINLEQAGRLVLLLDPSELLTRTERGLLDAFEAAEGQASS